MNNTYRRLQKRRMGEIWCYPSIAPPLAGVLSIDSPFLRHLEIRHHQARASSTATSASHPHNRTIYIAMSGGVDSSVAALQLLNSGHPRSKLRPVFVKNWSNDDDDDGDHEPSMENIKRDRQSSVKTGCEWRRDWNDLLAVCNQLSIGPPQLMDLSKEYWNRVWSPCLEAWETGKTPNADVMCNRYIKFGILAERVFRDDPNSFLATGHYARLTYTPSLKLLQAVDKQKDQSYYLSTVSSHILQRTIFPLGHLSKPQVRKIALHRGLVNAKKQESMGICLVEPTTGKGRFDKFLAKHIIDQPGDIVTTTGERLGEHRGLWRYTIGQRCRLPSQPSKLFVSHKDVASNRLVVVSHHDHGDLYSKIILCHDFHWIGGTMMLQSGGANLELTARVRTGTLSPIPCVATKLEGKRLRVELETAEHGVAPGQVIVLQRGEEVLGGGTIKMAFRDRHHEDHQTSSETIVGHLPTSLGKFGQLPLKI